MLGKISEKQAKQLLTAQFIEEAKFDIFGTLPSLNIRTGAAALKKNLAGPKLVKYYPIFKKLSKTTPKIEWEKGFKQYFQKHLGISDELMGVGQKLPDNDDDSEKEHAVAVAEAKKKAIEFFDQDQKLKAKFNTLVHAEGVKSHKAGKSFTLKELQNIVIQEHFIDPTDVKEDVIETNIEAKVDEANNETGDVNIGSNKKVKESPTDLNFSDVSYIESTIYPADFEYSLPTIPEQIIEPSRLPSSVLFEESLRRAFSNIIRNPSSKENNNGHVSNALSKLHIAPENNILRLYTAPSFFYSSSEEQYAFSPHARPVIGSQLADEALALERRKKVLEKFLNIAPYESEEFDEFCKLAGNRLYPKDPKKVVRFSSAYQKLKDPSFCMDIAEAEIAEEKNSQLHRLVVTNTGDKYSIKSDNDPVVISNRSADSENRIKFGTTNKLLSADMAESKLITLSKQRDSDDGKIGEFVNDFFAGGVSALAKLSVDEKTNVLNMLLKLIDEEESMFEAMELAEMPIGMQNNFTITELQSMIDDAKLGRYSANVAALNQPDGVQLDWCNKILELPTEVTTLTGFFNSYLAIHRAVGLLNDKIDAKINDENDISEVNANKEKLELLLEEMENFSKAKFQIKDEDLNAFVSFFVNSALLHRVTNAYVLLKYLKIQASRRANGDEPLVARAIYFLKTYKENINDREWMVSAVKMYLQDSRRTAVYYEPFHPQRRILIALKYNVNSIAGTDEKSVNSKLALIYERHNNKNEELRTAFAARSIDPKVINDNATLDFIKTCWKASGGYRSSKDIRDESHDEILKSLGKYKAAKKGQGKRAQKKKK